MKYNKHKLEKALAVNSNAPKDAHWRVYRQLLLDLGFTPESMPSIFSAIRLRDIKGLMDSVSSLGPQSILQETGWRSGAHALEFFRYIQAGAFLKKYPFPGSDTYTPALEKFLQAEEACRLFNKENWRSLDILSHSHPDFLGCIEEIRSDISNLLGKAPTYESIVVHAKHGPGVSLGDQYRGGKVTCYFKYSELPYTVTRGTSDLARYAILSDPRWIGALDNWYRVKNSIPFTEPISVEDFWSQVFKFVDGNRNTSVPKTAEIDRFIAIEPVLNVFFQLGVDTILKYHLKFKWGYDLYSQRRNQELALEGSTSNDLVTLDLKGASETVTLKICELYLPMDWYNLLFDLRSPKGNIKGEEITYEKISSMGNGYTFSLESLIFAALVRCAIRRTKSRKVTAVYGDDLIVPKTAFSYLKNLLELSGFSLNVDKTFHDGPFRESCGKDFYNGIDVRPIFLKRNLSTVPALFYLYNSLFCIERDKPWWFDLNFSKTKELIQKWIPHTFLQCVGPRSENLDTHLFCDRSPYIDKEGYAYYYKLVPSACTFNKYGRDFFFRKLMSNLKQRPQSNPWDKHLSTGNAFDITRRGYMRYKIRKVSFADKRKLRTTPRLPRKK